MQSQKTKRSPWRSTVGILLILIVGTSAYNSIRGPFEGKMAVKQADGTDSGAVVGGFFARNDVTSMAWGVGVLIIAGTWCSYLVRKGTNDEAPVPPSA